LARARAAGVCGLVTCGSDLEDSRAALGLAAEHEDVWATAGIHPHGAAWAHDDAWAGVEHLAAKRGAVALGETGLDYHYGSAERDYQLRNFEAHLDMAARLKLPVVVHSRSADGDTAGFIRQFRGRASGVMHCFAGGPDLLRVALDAGWMISFSGLVTFVPEIAGLVARVPEDRLLIETDSPYLAPVPRRGRRNEPSHVQWTCAAVADLRNEAVGDVAALTAANARRFFGL